MRHGMAGRKFSRTSSHRKAMFGNMATSLLKHERITTTLPKAKDLRRVVEPLITKAKAGDVHARREVMKVLKDESVAKKLIDSIAPMFKERAGGYTRIVKAGFRKGDAAPMAIIELVEKTPTEEAPKAEKKASKKAEEKADVKAEAKTDAPKKDAAKKPAAKKAASKKDDAEASK